VEAARGAALGLWPELAAAVGRGPTATIERILWLHAAAGAAEEDEPAAAPPPEDDGHAPPTVLERWVSGLPRHGAVRRLGRALARRLQSVKPR
jgi:hypothetical protein